MSRLATVAQSRLIDERTQSEFGISAGELMESAGRSASSYILTNFKDELKKANTIVVCGPGNNGGDGFVVARELKARGARGVKIVLASAPDALGELPRSQFERTKAAGVQFEIWSGAGAFGAAGLIVDALFGIGLSRPVDGPNKTLIAAINKSRAPTVSLDTPSGLDCDTGQVRGLAVKARATLTFGLAKPGFYLREGPGHCGRIEVFDIGFPLELVRDVANTHFVLSREWARRTLPCRPPAGNKSTFGHAVICAGSSGKWGAALLASEAAFRVGAGYVTLASNDENLGLFLKTRPEVMSQSLASFTPDPKRAYAVGPGLGIGSATVKFIHRLRDAGCERVVLDADALTSLAENPDREMLPGWVLTPHAGELARLLRSESQKVDADPSAAALEASKKYGCTVLFKGFHTVLAHRGRVLIVPTGNSALAKAGTGDVLTGMIGGLMAQGLEPARAAALASYIHGDIADHWVRSGKDRASLVALDLCTELPEALRRLRSKREREAGRPAPEKRGPRKKR
ncbi:MAG TPA: NAD(P)H-hydrate dehydratase [Bdellovibrionales bacterium]|nr:NAD(P)H-hydrate dehydratase [Bdellovibrionales bacterium]